MKESYIFGIIAAIFIATIFMSTPLINTATDSSTSLVYHSAVCPVVTRVDGAIERLPCKHNLITNGGKDHLKICLAAAGCGTPTEFVNLSVANCTPNTVAATDTTLCDGDDWNLAAQGDCGLASADGTYRTYSGNGAWNITYQWTSTCADAIVNATGLSNDSLLFAENAFASTVTLQSGDKLNVTWGIWVS